MADNIETIATIAMQSSKAWPAVFHQGTALCLWRAAVAAIEAAGFSIVPNADLAAARAENERLREALAQARPFVSDELRGTLECVCLLDPDTLAPIESTIDPSEAPHVERIRNVLNAIDAALAEKEPAK